MHSKSITGDSALSIIGGRNIADEYFQLRDDTEFLDYDVLVVGTVATDIVDQFDDFWNSTRALPLEQLGSKFTSQELAAEKAEISGELSATGHSIYSKAINSQYMRDLVDGIGTIYVAPAVLLYDGSAKLENPIDISHMTLIRELKKVINNANSSVRIITPYFIPTASGVDFWRTQINRGLDVTVVTNSLASTNHIPVHSGYARYRKDMLRMGASMYEARVNADDGSSGGKPKPLTLHSKLILIDERYLFVGSLNLDPRSIEINAEMGLLIDSPELARDFMNDLEADLDNFTYKLELDDSDRLLWRANINGKKVVETKEPMTSWWRRFKARIYGVLPESQL